MEAGGGAARPRLGQHELLHVFSFLGARDLLRAAQVDKVWNEVSETKELWRQLCLRRWSSCRGPQMVLGTQTWKQYYLCRSRLEFRMESGRPGKDFLCKAIAGHTGEIRDLAYISPNECRLDGKEKSVVCTVSSDCTVRAWDVHEAACAQGTLYTLTVPGLHVVSRVTEFPAGSVGLACSPDHQWVFVSAQNSDLGPKVFYTHSLLFPLEDEPPASTALPTGPSSGVCWAPDETARLMVMHKTDTGSQLAVTTYDLRAKKSGNRVNVLAKTEKLKQWHFHHGRRVEESGQSKKPSPLLHHMLTEMESCYIAQVVSNSWLKRSSCLSLPSIDLF
ncbi:F-box/WD repeat-containing protein 12-like isoform X4 [Carlito syrichta]|uniref:F-box/WD repeat-containing protein 12-like isoform X4 n=1 Tax=Carlito syrichta TaxID=1868482 RepID=A0A3Q0DJ01_CARSF|nr:F-box/WD repeat-containing protein 12-like isoform X4 [Carlito syrichta]